MPWFTEEYAGALAQMGLGVPEIVEIPDSDCEAALTGGEVEVFPTWMDMTLYYRNGAVPIRTVPLDIDVYTTGLIAADRLPLDLVERFRDAFVAGYDLQLEQPELGKEGFKRRYPDVADDHIEANWALFEPYAFDRVLPGSMEAEKWRRTIAYSAATHGLSSFPGEQMYLPELLTPALEYQAA